ncbi:MAG: ThiF family adenylyltransferase [Bacilli bacterium]|nr:MAG: ThiF family adenylyltransferase [Bacilli bacterium]
MFDRTIALIGEDNLNKIKSKHILIIGVGGVGGYAIEALIRSGIQYITLVDYDNIDISNINRQIIAKESNIGKLKVDAWKERINEINSGVIVKNFTYQDR